VCAGVGVFRPANGLRYVVSGMKRMYAGGNYVVECLGEVDRWQGVCLGGDGVAECGYNGASSAFIRCRASYCRPFFCFVEKACSAVSRIAL
jgi:hypothetical protein